jgi:hypothetical protein
MITPSGARRHPRARDIVIALFDAEELPYCLGPDMGSFTSARARPTPGAFTPRP